jgi:hypothetical protein
MAMPNAPPTHRFLALAFSLCAATCTAALAVPPAAIGPKPAHESSKDFDFLYGSWIVHNRRLTKRLANPLGAGIFRGRRQILGDQLDHGIRASTAGFRSRNSIEDPS